MSSDSYDRRPSRRDFLKGLGATGAGLVAGSVSAGSGLATSPAEAAVVPALRPGGHAHGRGGAPASSVDFGRIFPQLPPFSEANDTVRAALLEVGKPGGVMDAGDQLSAGPKALIVDPSVNGNPTAADPYGSNPDNPTMTAGSTFVGQFVDHDITFDQTSTLGMPQNPLISRNTRTPALDLDSVFGGGPGVRPDLYVHNADGSVGPKLKLGFGGVHEDIPRVGNGDGTYRGLLGDPRNDESVIIGGLHCAHILFYNRLLDELSEHDLRRFPAARHAERRNRYERFLIAREVTLWHYQWLLVNEHLPQIAGQVVVNEVLRRGNRFYRPPAGEGFMPIEFAGAAYRFGHSMVRPSYRANFTSGTGDSTSPTANPFFALVFDPNEPAFSDPVSHDRADLLGGYPAARRYIGWQTFFDLGDGQVKNNKKIDTTISSVLFSLPAPAIAPHTQTTPTVLPQRNLLRQLTWSLPSGQAVAKAMGAAPLGHPTCPTSPASTSPSAAAPHCGTTSSPKPRPSTTGSTSAPSAAGSSPRPSSASSAPIPPATSAPTPASGHSSAPTSSSDQPLTPTSPETAPTPTPTSFTTPASSTPAHTDDRPADHANPSRDPSSSSCSSSSDPDAYLRPAGRSGAACANSPKQQPDTRRRRTSFLAWIVTVANTSRCARLDPNDAARRQALEPPLRSHAELRLDDDVRRGLAVPRRRRGHVFPADRRLVDGDPHAREPRGRRAEERARAPAPGPRADPPFRPRRAVRQSAVRPRRTRGGIAVSTGSRGDAYDNAVAQPFFATLKKELVSGRSWMSPLELHSAVFAYSDPFYNRQRRHSGPEMLFPVATNNYDSGAAIERNGSTNNHQHHHHPHQVSRKPGQVRRSALASAQMRRRKCRRLT